MAPRWPRVSKSDTNNLEMSSSQSIYETVEGCHEYKIKGYSLAKGMGVGKYMTSGIFTVGGHEWVIHLYPDGCNQDRKEYISVYIKLVSLREEVRALYEFKLLDQSGKQKHIVESSEYPITFSTGSSWGSHQYMKRSDLETSSYLKDDLQTHAETTQTRKHYVISVPPSDMSQNLKGLLESEIDSDITIQVGSESFKAHKSILAARCPVFRAQFFGLVGNPDMETVAIEEFDPFAFKAMLLFLYSDKIPEPRELSDLDSDCTSTSIMEHLLVAADRFVLVRSKLMCEAKLCEEITPNTVATTLALADQHQCLQLKTACLNFAAEPENVVEVIKSDGFAELEKSFPSLFIDLFKASAAVNKK
ncbi:hypothetical protein MKW98_004212 [Papaver atlanticum]|uniref:Uncharacterized protein n=1 Tax=Papaver atlanticum TaxID=357466 RepID=A0AAD4XSH7_9MAGN|nr:hypothetical protein MKW98_004212 [Papaver atlanticum]